MTTLKDPDHCMQLVSLASFLLFLWIYKFCGPKMSTWMVPRYTDLTARCQIDWNLRGSSVTARTNFAISIGYLATDALILIYHIQDSRDIQDGQNIFYIVHHCAVIGAYYYISTYGLFLWIATWRSLSELSSPFVNVRFSMAMINFPTDEWAYIFVAVAMVTTCFFARILIIPFHWYNNWLVMGQANGLFTYQCYLYLVCLLLDLLNLYWFSKIIEGVMKFIKTDTYDACEKEK